MEVQDGFFFETNELKTYLKDEIAVIKVKGNVFGTITDLAESGKFLSLIDMAEKNPDIKALLLINEPGCLGEDEYDTFLRKVLSREEDAERASQGTLIPKDSRIREINILNRVITHLVEFKKISVMGQQGTIVTPIFWCPGFIGRFQVCCGRCHLLAVSFKIRGSSRRRTPLFPVPIRRSQQSR